MPERKSSLKTPSKYAYDDKDNLVGIDTLKDGAYDEKESHDGFLEALTAWRDAGKR